MRKNRIHRYGRCTCLFFYLLDLWGGRGGEYHRRFSRDGISSLQGVLKKKDFTIYPISISIPSPMSNSTFTQALAYVLIYISPSSQQNPNKVSNLPILNTPIPKRKRSPINHASHPLNPTFHPSYTTPNTLFQLCGWDRFGRWGGWTFLHSDKGREEQE